MFNHVGRRQEVQISRYCAQVVYASLEFVGLIMSSASCPG